MSVPSRVSAGTPVGRLLRASTINYTLEGAEIAHRLSTGERRPPQDAGRGGRVLVRNDTDEDLDGQFRILGLTDILIDPGDSDEATREFKQGFAFVGKKPDSSRDGPGRIAVTQSPVEDGKLVQCICNGPTVAYIELDDGATYTAADIETNQHEKFIAAEHGPYVVMWHETGPGTKLAVVNLGAEGERMRFAKLNGTLNTGSLTSPSTATAEFYDRNASNQLVASGNTFTVTNFSGDLSGTTGDLIIVGRVQGVWHVLAIDC